MSVFNPSDWYYFVAGDQSRVFATARGIYVPLTDAAYLAWLAQNNEASPIDTAANLGAVMAAVQIRPTDPAVLDAYQDQQATSILGRASTKISFNHENRIRALEGKAAITMAQFKTAVKAQL